MSSIFINGEPLDSKNAHVLYDSSAFHWGMSVFTTGRIEDGKALFGQAHFERLEQGVKWLFDCENEDFLEDFKKAYHQLEEKKEDLKFRITLFFDRHFGKLQRVIEFSPYKSVESLENILSFKQENYPQGFKSQVKVGIYADSFKAKRSLDSELFFFNEREEFLEASIANVILREKETGEWVVPVGDYLKGIGLTHGLRGVPLKSKKVFCHEKELYDRLALVNALRGIQPVKRWDERNIEGSREDFLVLQKAFNKNSIEESYLL